MEAGNRWVGIRVWLGLCLAFLFENILFKFSTRDFHSSLMSNK